VKALSFSRRSCERKTGKRNRHVDANLTCLDLIHEPASKPAVVGEDRSPIPSGCPAMIATASFVTGARTTDNTGPNNHRNAVPCRTHVGPPGWDRETIRHLVTTPRPSATTDAPSDAAWRDRTHPVATFGCDQRADLVAASAGSPVRNFANRSLILPTSASPIDPTATTTETPCNAALPHRRLRTRPRLPQGQVGVRNTTMWFLPPPNAWTACCG